MICQNANTVSMRSAAVLALMRYAVRNTGNALCRIKSAEHPMCPYINCLKRMAMSYAGYLPWRKKPTPTATVQAIAAIDGEYDDDSEKGA